MTASLPLILGHRGSSFDAPENTLASFRQAWAEGADGIEADFRLTADGAIVCMHDDTTTRTTGVPLAVHQATMKELRGLDAGRWKGERWAGAAIPTLDDVLAALPVGSWFNIEIKSGPEIIAPLHALLKNAGVSPDRIRLLSFSADLVTELTRRLPDWHCCWLCDYRRTRGSTLWRPSRTEIIETLARCGAAGLASADRAILDAGFVTELKSHRKELHVWTVDRTAAARRVSRLGVDAIMTNRPGWLRRQLLT